MAALSEIDNPITWQELTHQRRMSTGAASRLRLVGPLLVVFLIFLVTLTLILPDYPTRELGIYAIWLVQLITVLRCLALGSNAISREHVGQTWDTLVLTGISTRQILYGKWRAVLRRAAPWMLMLGTIRLAMIPVFMMALINVFATYTVRYATYYGSSTSTYGNYGGYQEAPIEISWVPWAAVLAVVMSVALTVLEVLACTAIGLAASAITRNGVLAMISALIARFIPIVLFSAFTRFELGQMSSNAYRVLRFAPFAIADSGTAPLSRLSVPYTPLSLTTHVDALQGLALATLVLVILLVIAVSLAWGTIRWTGALPDPHEQVDRAA